ncbi:MAG: hypothetical protein V3S08_01270 [Phycisphaerales bacterium]
MTPFSLRPDIERTVINGFALALGITPGDVTPPTVGYTIAYASGHDDEPDTYSFYVAVSHEQVALILQKAFALLPEEVCAIVEISSRDAYRQTDVFLSQEEISKRDFLRTWDQWQPILLEDGSIAAGANSESPFVEIFVDQWKGVSIIVPLDMHDDVERLLASAGLNEVQETWALGDENPALDNAQIRPVLADLDGMAADIDDVLMELRHDWGMELNIDPDTNVDGGGRSLGLTLWHAVLGVHRAGDTRQGADMLIWATAGSLTQLETLIEGVMEQSGEWVLAEVYSTDRIAYDERPDELSDLAPRYSDAEIHLVSIDRHTDQPPEKSR